MFRNEENQPFQSVGGFSVKHYRFFAKHYRFFANTVNESTKNNMPRPVKSPLQYMANRNGRTFFISHAVPDEISDVIGLLKPGKPIGPNSIPVKI